MKNHIQFLKDDIIINNPLRKEKKIKQENKEEK